MLNVGRHHDATGSGKWIKLDRDGGMRVFFFSRVFAASISAFCLAYHSTKNYSNPVTSSYTPPAIECNSGIGRLLIGNDNGSINYTAWDSYTTSSTSFHLQTWSGWYEPKLLLQMNFALDPSYHSRHLVRILWLPFPAPPVLPREYYWSAFDERKS